MLILLVGLLCAVGPAAYYFMREKRLKTPAVHWPRLAPILRLDYKPDPPRMTGKWNGRHVEVKQDGRLVKITAFIPRPSRLRVEVGPKEEVARRAGVLVPDPVATGDQAFDGRLLARCSDKAAGARLFDSPMRRRILEQETIEILGQGDRVAWSVPFAYNPDVLEPIFEVVTLIAEEMEAHV